MKLRSIEAFCTAVEEKSISAAARRMYLSQPSVSERLTELEQETRVPLLKRSHSGVELTAEGVAFYERARRVLDEMKALRSTVEHLQEKSSMKLRFAACVTVGDRLLPEWLGRFKQRMPEVVPIVLTGNDQVIINAVKGGDMPIGVVASDKSGDYLKSTIILDDELVVVVAPGHPWMGQRVSPEDLSSEPFISREQGSTMRVVIEQTLKNIGNISLNVHMELGSTTAIREAVESGLGFSILSRADVQRKLEAGTLVQVKGLSIPWSFKLVRHPSAPLSVAEECFYEFILNMFRQAERSSNVENPPELTPTAP